MKKHYKLNKQYNVKTIA